MNQVVYFSIIMVDYFWVIIYNTWTSAKRIPYHKEGKRLRFLKSEIDTWLKKPEAHFKSIEQIEDEARQYVESKRKPSPFGSTFLTQSYSRQ